VGVQPVGAPRRRQEAVVAKGTDEDVPAILPPGAFPGIHAQHRRRDPRPLGDDRLDVEAGPDEGERRAAPGLDGLALVSVSQARVEGSNRQRSPRKGFW
jgi:hypothetical protein